MASLSHHAAVLMTLSLLAGCGGDRSRAGAGTDTTGATAARDTVARDTATRDTAASAMSAAPADTAAARDSATRPTAVAPAPKPAPKPTHKKAAVAGAQVAHDTAAAPSAQAARDTTRVQKAESTQSAAAPAPAPTPQQQDTSSQGGELVDAYHQPPKDTVSQAVYDGWKQFNLNCARCHGEDALGTTIAPHLIMSLKPDGPINTKELFMQTVCAGRPGKGMPSWCALGLDMNKISDIYLYVKGRSDAKISPGRPAVKKEG